MELIKKKSGIQVYHHPNREIRSYLTTDEISRFRVEVFRAADREAFEDQLKGLGTIGEHVVREVTSIPGVRDLEIKPRELRVIKKTSASWDAIEEKIIQALNTAFRRKKIRIV